MTTDPYDDNNNKISSLAVVEPSVIMGRNNVIMEGVIIRNGVIIGNNNYIGPYCIIGDNAEKIGFMTKKGRVVIGNHNKFMKQVTIDSGTVRDTVICNNVLMLKNSHVGHDANIENSVVLSCNSVVGGFTDIGKGCNFGLGAVCHQRLQVPINCMVGMNATITKKTDLQPGKKYVGTPARILGDNIKK